MVERHYSATAATANMPVGLPELDAILAANLRPLARDPKKLDHLLRRVRETMESQIHDLSNLRRTTEELRRERSRKGAPSTLNPIDALRFVSPEELEAATDRITSERLRTLRALITDNMAIRGRLVALTEEMWQLAEAVHASQDYPDEVRERMGVLVGAIPAPGTVEEVTVPDGVAVALEQAGLDDELRALVDGPEVVHTPDAVQVLGAGDEDVDDEDPVLEEPFGGVRAAQPVVPEPEPVAVPEPEPVAVPEPEPVAVPEPEPVAVPEPEPVFTANPFAAAAPIHDSPATPPTPTAAPAVAPATFPDLSSAFTGPDTLPAPAATPTPAPAVHAPVSPSPDLPADTQPSTPTPAPAVHAPVSPFPDLPADTQPSTPTPAPAMHDPVSPFPDLPAAFTGPDAPAERPALSDLFSALAPNPEPADAPAAFTAPSPTPPAPAAAEPAAAFPDLPAAFTGPDVPAARPALSDLFPAPTAAPADATAAFTAPNPTTPAPAAPAPPFPDLPADTAPPTPAARPALSDLFPAPTAAPAAAAPAAPAPPFPDLPADTAPPTPAARPALSDLFPAPAANPDTPPGPVLGDKVDATQLTPEPVDANRWSFPTRTEPPLPEAAPPPKQNPPAASPFGQPAAAPGDGLADLFD